MRIEDIILIVILVAILGGAITYLVRAKKKGVKCIGCPSGSECASKQKNASGGCGCGCSGCHTEDEK